MSCRAVHVWGSVFSKVRYGLGLGLLRIEDLGPGGLSGPHINCHLGVP